MYKFLLAWRYLRTRYIALASVISVTLGVATLIIVNSVMAGFTHEMNERLNGMLSDIVIEGPDLLTGFTGSEFYAEEIREILGDDVEQLTTTVHVPAMLNADLGGYIYTRQLSVIGIDVDTYAEVSDFANYVLHPANQEQLSFLLRESGYGEGRPDFPKGAGWDYRRRKANWAAAISDISSIAPEDLVPTEEVGPVDPYANTLTEAVTFDPARDQHAGIILGIGIAAQRKRVEKENGEVEVHDIYALQPGDDIQLTFPTAASPPRAETAPFTVVDFYESKMSEYDFSFAFVRLQDLQRLRGMISSEGAAVTAIQLKLKEGADLLAARDKLKAHFQPDEAPYFRVQTWMDMQAPLLSAVQLETTLLNILLFLIIAVAGFGILATFFMIVVEKTRDIGVLKSLGAPSSGIMSIFLAYGLSLGAVGSGVGMIIGLLFVAYINNVADVIEKITGQVVFDPTVYYFDQIPTITHPSTVVVVVLGATLIAVMASVLPALRAARLHPVEALRYE
jgi:lipoprotein-releasing system permease protein